MSTEEATEIKCVFLGDSGVGKTCMLNTYVNGSNEDTLPTIGAAYLSKFIVVDSEKIELMIWDTAGQEMYRGLAPMYYRNAKIAFLIFDISQKKTFDAVSYWAEELHLNAGEDIVIAVCGNKCDLEDKREVSFDTAQEVASSLGATYFETSAKTGAGIERLFQTTASQALKTKTDVNMPEQDKLVEVQETRSCC